MIKILVGVWLQQRISSQVLELARVDSRAYVSKSHQVLKRSLAHLIIFLDQVKKEKKKKTFKRRLLSRFVFSKILFLDKMERID